MNRAHNQWKAKTALRAGSAHLFISVLVAMIVCALIFWVWYPGELASAQGVSYLVLVLIGVDVVIGPLITTVIFRPGKPGLRFDLMVIAMLQTIAMLYGMKAIYGGRPAYVVFNVDRFDAVAMDEVVRSSLDRVDPRLEVSLLGPKWVAARLPQSSESRSQIMFSALQGGADLPQLPELFVDLHEEKSNILEKIRPIGELQNINEVGPDEWAILMGEFRNHRQTLGYLPLRANARDAAVIMNGTTGEVLGIRMLTPRFHEANKEIPKR